MAVRAHRVVRELLAVDELFDAQLRDVPQQREYVVQLVDRVDAVGVGRASTIDGLDDKREPDLLSRLPYAGHGRRTDMPRRADTGGVEHLLHPLLVAKRQGLLDGHARQPERLTDPGGQDHVRLPQALHLVDPGVAGQVVQGGEHGSLVGQRYMFVVVERLPSHGRQRVRRLVADANDPRADGRERAGEERHLGRVAGGEHHDVHCASASSTWTPPMMRCRASLTTSVSGSRKMTNPSPR